MMLIFIAPQCPHFPLFAAPVRTAVERVCLRDIGRDGLQDRGYYACEEQAWVAAAPQIASAIAQSGNLALGGAASLTAIRVSAG